MQLTRIVVRISVGVMLLLCTCTACRDAHHATARRVRGDAEDAREVVAEIAIPPELRGLPVGPLDADGRPAVIPCETCHEPGDAAVPLPRVARGLAGPHRALRVDHGTVACAGCHDPARRDALRLADGQSIPMVDAMRLCAQCHGAVTRAYRHGAHGGLRGTWDDAYGARTRNHCVACHDPHAPDFGAFEPMPAPRDRYVHERRGARDE